MSSQQKAEQFIKEVVALMEKYDMSISPFNPSVGFQIENYNQISVSYFQDAEISIINNVR